ncbi:MAG: universal stress protein [Pseudomonadota bacterium]|nr:universal stress protein [Pseudomonadota bacterium]
MYHKIMVAIGDDEVFQNALREALRIAAAYGAEICIMHAVASQNDDESGGHPQNGAALLEKTKSIASEALTVETRLLDADGEYDLNGISDAVAHAVVEWGADLLVVGTKGRRGLERLVIGSVAGQLVNTVDISILLARSH